MDLQDCHTRVEIHSAAKGHYTWQAVSKQLHKTAGNIATSYWRQSRLCRIQHRQPFHQRLCLQRQQGAHEENALWVQLRKGQRAAFLACASKCTFRQSIDMAGSSSVKSHQYVRCKSILHILYSTAQCRLSVALRKLYLFQHIEHVWCRIPVQSW